jgi:hypothetical protein
VDDGQAIAVTTINFFELFAAVFIGAAAITWFAPKPRHAVRSRSAIRRSFAMIFIGIAIFVGGMLTASLLSAIRGPGRARGRRRSDRPYAL